METIAMKMTRQGSLSATRWLLSACGLFFAVPAGFAQQAVANGVPSARTGVAAVQAVDAKAGREVDESAVPDTAGAQGIKVHGHWTLVLKNADGSIVDRREFNNSLVTTNGNNASGPQLLALLLSGNGAVGAPAIGLIQGAVSGDASAFCSTLSPLSPGTTCYLFVSSANNNWTYQPAPSQTVVQGLNTYATFVPTASLVSTGNFTVPSGMTSIAGVQELYSACVAGGNSFHQANNAPGGIFYGFGVTGNFPAQEADISPKACVSSAFTASSPVEEPIYGALTSTAVTANNVPTPLAVTAGQVVTVTVTLTFS